MRFSGFVVRSRHSDYCTCLAFVVAVILQIGKARCVADFAIYFRKQSLYRSKICVLCWAGVGGGGVLHILF